MRQGHARVERLDAATSDLYTLERDFTFDRRDLIQAAWDTLFVGSGWNPDLFWFAPSAWAKNWLSEVDPPDQSAAYAAVYEAFADANNGAVDAFNGGAEGAADAYSAAVTAAAEAANDAALGAYEATVSAATAIDDAYAAAATAAFDAYAAALETAQSTYDAAVEAAADTWTAAVTAGG